MCGPPELAVADAIDTSFDLPLHRLRNRGCHLRGDDRGSVISALASRPGVSPQPLGGGSRPTCEVLIGVVLRCMFLSSPPSCDPVHDNTIDIAIEPVAARSHGRRCCTVTMPICADRGRAWKWGRCGGVACCACCRASLAGFAQGGADNRSYAPYSPENANHRSSRWLVQRTSRCLTRGAELKVRIHLPPAKSQART